MKLHLRHLHVGVLGGLIVHAAATIGCGGPDEESAPKPDPATHSGDSTPTQATDAATERDDQGFIIPMEGVDRPWPIRSELGEFFALIEAYRTGPARVRIRKHLNLHPEDGQAQFLFGLSYHRERQYNQAIPYYEEATRFDPQYDNTWHFLGWALYYEGQADRSRAMFEQHLKFVPDADDSHFALGLLDLDAGELREAAARFSTALELIGDAPGRAKDRAKSLLGLADVALARDDAEAARQKILESIDAFDQSFESWARLARVEGQLGNAEAAEEARQRSEFLRAQVDSARQPQPSAPPSGRDD